MGEKRYTEPEWRDITDLRAHWRAFCDADPFEGADTFAERMEARGFVRMRPVRNRDFDEISFAAEKGISPGGWIWELTKKGHTAFTPANPTEDVGGTQ